MKNFRINIKNDKELGGKEIEITYKKQPKEVKKDTNIWVKLITGVLIGFVNGFWGGGGGMICVPLLMNVIKLPEKKSHATTLLIMLPLSISSLVVYMFNGNLPLIDAIKIGVGFVIGGVLGANLLKKINNVFLGYFFSIVIIIGGIKLLI